MIRPVLVKRFWKSFVPFGKHLLAVCEPIMAALYWPCLQAKGHLQDQRSNEAPTEAGR